MAVQKFGPRLEVFGTDEQKKQIALAAAKHGMRVEFPGTAGGLSAGASTPEGPRARTRARRDREMRLFAPDSCRPEILRPPIFSSRGSA
jgi:hypothetical protein